MILELGIIPLSLLRYAFSRGWTCPKDVPNSGTHLGLLLVVSIPDLVSTFMACNIIWQQCVDNERLRGNGKNRVRVLLKWEQFCHC